MNDIKAFISDYQHLVIRHPLKEDVMLAAEILIFNYYKHIADECWEYINRKTEE